jgi:predicted O-linked N-acetylglucosamine transferase (SPINDLY family)
MALTTETKQLLREALDCHRKGSWRKAEPLYQQILDEEPDQPDTLHLLGVLKNQLGDPAAAADLIRQAIALQPHRVEYHNSLANALRAQGDLRRAAATYEHALSLDPRSVEVLTNLGALLEHAGNLEDATLCYLRALEIKPDYGDAHFTLANLLKKVGNFAQAVQHYEQAIAPGGEYSAEALNNLGTALRQLGRHDEAVESFRRTIELRPRSLEAHLNLADALEAAGCLEEAARMYQTAIGFRPDSAIAYSGAAGIMQDQGRAERATAAYRKAVELAPQNPILHSNLLLHMHYDPQPSSAEILEAHRDWAARHACQPALKRRARGNRDRHKPLRIGFVSPDFRCHPVGFFLAPVLGRGRHEDAEFVCYSDVAVPDSMTERLAHGAHVWRSTFPLDDEALAETIRQDEIDILIDLAGHTRHNRLAVFARKPAPVQVTWAGYPNTTGMPQMDYLISDRWQTPEGSEKWFTEKVLRMPEGYVSYSPPDYAPSVAPLPAASAGRVTFGCFNRLAKINTEVVLLWARLLNECPGSRLILRSHGLGDEAVVRRYKKMFAREGIEPARVILRDACPHRELLAGYGEVDIALDPFPYSGGLTTCEALWMGVPVVTLAGERLASRHSASHLSNVGLPELIAATPDEYLAVARDLSADAGRLAALRANLRERVAASALADGERFTGNLLALLRGAWQSWCDDPAG